MSSKGANFLIVLLVCLFSSSTVGQQRPASSNQAVDKVPKIIFTDDMGTITFWATPPTREIIEKVVETYAGYGVDVVSWDLSGGTEADYKSKYADLPPASGGQGSENIRHLVDSGVDVPAVLAEASHRLGIGFWPAVRMNASSHYPSPIHQNHPEWFLTGYKPWADYAPTSGKDVYSAMLNYELPEVRAFMMNIFRELVERYDADGLLLDFVRYPSLFDPDHDLQDTQMFTDYIGQVRKMLDEVGKKKGKYLPLAVQVLARPNENLRYGEDVGAWIRKGYVDYVLPSQFNNMDDDLPVEQWLKITKGTHCQLFPTLHPYFLFPWTTENLATREALRATAHLYYAEGAAGLSTMNMGGGGLEGRWLRELRDPGLVACGPFDYRFVPVGNDIRGAAMKTDNMSWWATTPIRVADDPAKLAEATLWVTIENAKDQTELEFSLNGKPIPRIDQAGKMVYTAFPAGDPNTWRFAFTKAQLPLVKGINQFGVMVHSSRAYEASWVTVKQIDPMVLAAEGAAKPRRRRNRIVRAPGSSFVILRLTCFRVRTN
ncbi:MAG: family 10 glycosylhydrolase [Terriglobales bacterium]